MMTSPLRGFRLEKSRDVSNSTFTRQPVVPGIVHRPSMSEVPGRAEASSATSSPRPGDSAGTSGDCFPESLEDCQ